MSALSSEADMPSRAGHVAFKSDIALSEACRTCQHVPHQLESLMKRIWSLYVQ